MATKIKLMRLGKVRAPYYRVVVADARTKRDGRSIETIGKYHPKDDPSFIEVDSERAQYWLGVGAQPTEAVTAILKVTGDWQRFRGEAPPPPMKTAAARTDKRATFEAAARESGGQPTAEATTPRARAKRVPEKVAAPTPAAPTAAAPTADAPAAPTPAAPTPAPAADAPTAGSPTAGSPTADQVEAAAAEAGTTPTEARAEGPPAVEAE